MPTDNSRGGSVTLEELMVRMDITDSINRNAIRRMPVSVLRFNDGMTITVDGPLRVIRKSDGHYVVGEGMCIPVNDYAEGVEMIKRLQNEDA